MTQTGKIIRIVPDKGFGFVAAPDGVEYFFHRSALGSSNLFDALQEGDAVVFVPTEGPKGPRAESVVKA